MSVVAPIELGNTDVVFEVRSNDELRGSLYVSKGRSFVIEQERQEVEDQRHPGRNLRSG